MDNEGPVETGIKRRSLIKRAGIVGAGVAAWSSPTVTSLASRAYAGSAPTGCKSCIDSCGGYAQCNDNCFCFPGFGDPSKCSCGTNSFCSDLQVCTSQSDCTGGGTCVRSCCDGSNATGVCIPACDNTLGALVGSGLKAAGN